MQVSVCSDNTLDITYLMLFFDLSVFFFLKKRHFRLYDIEFQLIFFFRFSGQWVDRVFKIHFGIFKPLLFRPN